MRMKNIVGICVLGLLSNLSLIAQDQQFSQFYASPLTLNPALTGTMDGTYRIGINYRDQGRSLVEVPFSTVSAGIDFRFGLDTRTKAKRDKFGVGMVFFNDKSASVNFFTSYIGVSGAFHKSLSKQEDQFLSIGIQGGIAQRNVNYDNFTFDDQFDGSGAYDLPTEEVLPVNNFSYNDLSIGLHYTYAPEGAVGVFLGGTIHHIMEPQLSFYSDAEVPNDNKLFRKYTGHLGFRFPLGSQVQLLPRALVYIQGPHTAYNAGTNIRFEMGSNNSAFHMGAYGRFTTNVATSSNITWDAAVAMVGIETNGFLIGFSYDAKILSITSGGKPRSALEFSLTYVGNYDDSESLLCPSF